MDSTNVIRKSSLAPTILICGGAGFIGSHLTESLLLKGASVVVVDNFSTGKKEYLNNLLDNPRFTLIRHDINEGIPANIESVDYIFHLASTESYIYSNNTISLDSLLTNALGTKNLLDFARKADAKFLLVSSISVYQGQIGSYDMVHYFGKNTYEENKYTHSEAKRFAEALVWEYYKTHKIDARIVRIPEVYGPKMDFDSCGELGRLLKTLLKNQNLTLYGDGLEKNYFLYVTDVIAGIVKAQFSDNSKGKIYSLAPQEPVTTIELSYLLKALSNGALNITFKEDNKNKQKDLVIENMEAYKDLKWSPKTNLKEGIAKTLKWYSYELNPHPFKPGIFIEKEKEREKEKAPAFSGITSLAEIAKKEEPVKTSEPVQEYPFNPNTHISTLAPLPTVTSTKPVEIVKEKKHIKFPSFKFPVFPKFNFAGGGIKKQMALAAILALAFSILFFGIKPAIGTVYFAMNGGRNLDKATKNTIELNIEEAEKNGNASVESFRRSSEELSQIGWVFLLLRQEERLRNYAKVLKIGEYGASGITNSAQGIKPIISIWENVKPNSQAAVNTEELSKAVLSFKKAKEDLERAEAEIKGINYNYLDPKTREQVMFAAQNLPEAIKFLETAEGFSEETPDILGYIEPKNYLILFQNPTELRANGGFIGSYSVVTFDQGKIKELVIDDIYNIDGQLDNNDLRIPSYAPIKQYLKQDYLRIRDANWQASFPDSAKTILDLFESANGTDFDGVVAIDTYVVRDFLKTLGPVYLTAYNEEINSENLYEKAQYHAEADYTEGSQQKRAFLTVLGSKLLETIFSSDKSKISYLSKDIYQNLQTKHILLYLPNNKLASTISENNWDGKVNETEGDYIFIVDSNLSANKSDYFIKKDANYLVKNKYRDGALEVLLTINYEHTGKDNTWPGGPYTDYLRVLVPDNSFLHKATFKVGEAEEKDITESVISGKESSKKTFETAFILNPTERATVTFNYTLPSKISLDKGENIYNLYWQKQPGTEAIPFTINFEEPFGKEIVSTIPEFKEDRDTFTYAGTLIQDFRAVLQIK